MLKIMITTTSGRRQSKTLLTIDERGSKIDRNSFRATNGNLKLCFYLLRSTFVDSINVFDSRLPGVITCYLNRF